MKETILAFLVAAGLLALGHTALAHEATIPNSTEIFDCDYAITTVSRSDYLICDDLEGFYADETNKSRFRRQVLDCPQLNWGDWGEDELRGKVLDELWNKHKASVFNTCRPWAAKRRDRLENTEGEGGALCEDMVRKAKSPDGGCKAQGKKVRILYHQHRKQNQCIANNAPIWDEVHFSVDCQ